jgi:type IV secretion system protein VirB6/type IV secretion system protein TrbL
MKNLNIKQAGSSLSIFILLIAFSLDANAALDNTGILDDILGRYKTAAAAWQSVIMAEASFLFWTLGAISLAWKMGQLILTKADIGDFFAELIRFSTTFGFYFWLLTNATGGLDIAGSIISSLRQLGANAGGLDSSISPSEIVNVGFAIFDKVVTNSSLWSPVDTIAMLLLAAVILIVLALISVNMLLLLVSSWILLYAGIFLLGMGGSSWTSDMAINYYKTVLGIAVQLFVMVLLVGIGSTFIEDYHAKMDAGTLTMSSMAVMMIVSIVLLNLTNKVPPLVAGIVSGGGLGAGGGIGNFGAGAAMGAAMTAASMGGAALAAAGGATMSGAANVAGAMDAFSAASGSGGMDDNSMDRGSSMMSTGPKKAAMDAPSLGDYDTGGSSSKGHSPSSRIASAVKSMAMDKKDEIVGNTIGGKIATSIRAADAAAKAAAAEEEDGTLSAANEQPSSPDQSEIDDFVNKT